MLLIRLLFLELFVIVDTVFFNDAMDGGLLEAARDSCRRMRGFSHAPPRVVAAREIMYTYIMYVYIYFYIYTYNVYTHIDTDSAGDARVSSRAAAAYIVSPPPLACRA